MRPRHLSIHSGVAPLAIAATLIAAPAVAETRWTPPQEPPAAATLDLAGTKRAPAWLALRADDAAWPPAQTNATSIDVRSAMAQALASWRTDATAERRARRLAIAAFYASRENAPMWRQDDDFSAAAKSATQTLRDAERDGLRLVGKTPMEGARWSLAGELDLSEAIADYAAQAGGARVDPAKISRLIGARPQPAQPAQVLAVTAAAGDDAGAALADFNPPHAGYRALRDKLAELRAARAGAARVADAANVSDATPRKSFATMTESEAKRIEAEIIANMERWRWMPRDMGAARVEVNIPQFELALLRDGKPAHRTRVVVGKTSTPTPMFSDLMRFVVVNPSWSVPPSIIHKEMAPKNGGDLSYLAAKGFQVSYRNGRVSVRQPPGERNALGRVKFVFPNDFAVYLHDTPSRSLFANVRRAYSHGCVRVDQPFKLAEAVLNIAGEWPEPRLRRMVGPAERRIDLSDPLPVHIEYFTAAVDENGDFKTYDDIYGYSAKVRAALAL